MADVALDEMAAIVAGLVASSSAQGLVVFDLSGVTGHPDHVRATEAALAAAESCDLGVLSWMLPIAVATSLASEYGAAFTGHEPGEIDVVLQVSRERQLDAVTCHPSQPVPGSVLWRRLEQLGDTEHLRWLRRS